MTSVASRHKFAEGLAKLDLGHVERAIALLWYYRTTQEFEERSASELANDLHDEGFAKPKVDRLRDALAKSRSTIRGKRPQTFQISRPALGPLTEKYGALLGEETIEVSGAVLPAEITNGTRTYIERLAFQLNAAYEKNLYDAAAVMMRRLMESLIIEAYVHGGRTSEIQTDKKFLGLDSLISRISSDLSIDLFKGSGRVMNAIKEMGDTAAHDRVYLTKQIDIDDHKASFRKLISHLLSVSGFVQK